MPVALARGLFRGPKTLADPRRTTPNAGLGWPEDWFVA
jgi:hypothetical protein